MQKIDIFAQAGAVHGVKYIFGANYGKVTRVFWTFSVVLSICGFFYYLHPVWIKLMFEPEILTKMNEEHVDHFPFPAITICPQIFADLEIFDFQNYLKNDTQDFTQEECRVVYANFHWCGIENIALLPEYCTDAYESTYVVDYIMKSAPRKEFHSSNFKLRPSKTVLYDDGVCYTYNMLSYSQMFNTENIHDDFKQFQKFLPNGEEDFSTWSPETDLKIAPGSDIVPKNERFVAIQFVLTENNTKNICAAREFRVIIHRSNELVMPLSNILQVNYNESKKFALTIKSRRSDDRFRGYPPKSRNCYFEGEKPLKFFKTYTKHNCQLECKANATLKLCGCSFYWHPRDKNTSICKFNETIYEECKLTYFDCDCFSPCNDVMYDVTTEALKMDPIPDEDDLTKIETGSSYSIFYFFISGEYVEETENFLAYNAQNFISDFGGLLGLFMGCSVLSLVEIFFYILVGLSSISLSYLRRNHIQEKTWATSKVIPESVPITEVLEALDRVTKTVQDIQKRHEEKIQSDEKRWAKIEEKFERIGETLTEMHSQIHSKLSRMDKSGFKV